MSQSLRVERIDSEWVVDEFERGASPLDIARDSGEWWTLIARTLRQEGYDPGDPPWYDEEALRTLYEDEGLGPGGIAASFQTHASIIRVALRTHGLETDAVCTEEELRRLLDVEDMTYAQAADELGCVRKTVSRYAKRFGLNNA